MLLWCDRYFSINKTINFSSTSRPSLLLTIRCKQKRNLTTSSVHRNILLLFHPLLLSTLYNSVSPFILRANPMHSLVLSRAKKLLKFPLFIGPSIHSISR